MASRKTHKPNTVIAHAGRHPHDHFGVVNPPVYHASTILRPSLAQHEESRKPDYPGYRYGRYGTPTSRAFEEAVAAIYGADQAVAVSSGLAAIALPLMALLQAGDHLLMVDSVYFPTRNFCNKVLAKFGVETTYYDPLIGAGIAELIRPNTKVVYVESPGSQTFEIQDVPAIAEAAHRAGAAVMCDNTWASAICFKPFDKGVDVVCEAVTKYICGHSDVMMGVVVANAPHAQAIRDHVRLHGNASGPDDLYLAQRGLRTMAVRMQRCGENGLALARFLQTRPEVDRVLHPGLPEFPGHALWKRDFSGCSGLFSFTLKAGYPKHALAAMLDGLELYGMGASWGGYESLILPNDPHGMRTATTWDAPGQLLRIHAGLEDIEDLKADLAAGLDRLTEAARATAAD